MRSQIPVIFTILMFSQFAFGRDSCSKPIRIDQLNDQQAIAICNTLNSFGEDELGPIKNANAINGDPRAIRQTIRLLLKGDHVNHPYKVSILDAGTSTCSHPIVLLGESHYKYLKASEAGIRVVKNFRFRGFEGVDEETIKSIPGLSEALGIYDVYEAYIKAGMLFGSTISEAQKEGIILWDNRHESDGAYDSTFLGFAKFLAAGGSGDPHLYIQELQRCYLTGHSLPQELRNVTRDPVRFAKNFRELLRADSKAQFNFHLEPGQVDTTGADCTKYESEACLNWVLARRNEQMAENIMTYANAIPCGEPFLAVVGSRHLDGLVSTMESTGQVKKREPLSPPSGGWKFW